MATTLITGASSGIGATYARRFAARGHDLVLVARRTDRLDALATELRAAHGIGIEVITADLADRLQAKRVADRLRDGAPIDIFINNAGASLPGEFADADPAAVEQLIQLNVMAPTLLASAAVGGMIRRGSGAVINIASVLAFVPEYFPGIYSPTKAFMLTFSRGLAAEVGPKGVYVQTVIPAATRTEIWEKSGTDIGKVPGVMDVEDLVDAALVGFDRREEVTIPAVHDLTAWEAFEKARGMLASGFSNSEPAQRYRA